MFVFKNLKYIIWYFESYQSHLPYSLLKIWSLKLIDVGFLFIIIKIIYNSILFSKMTIWSVSLLFSRFGSKTDGQSGRNVRRATTFSDRQVAYFHPTVCRLLGRWATTADYVRQVCSARPIPAGGSVRWHQVSKISWKC